jgi:FAD binding domain
VVSPASVEEVQAVVRAANKYGVPLSPVATGKNNGYGGAAPRLAGAVVVNTGAQMNKILEVNERCGYALLEPGVSNFDLDRGMVLGSQALESTIATLCERIEDFEQQTGRAASTDFPTGS